MATSQKIFTNTTLIKKISVLFLLLFCIHSSYAQFPTRLPSFGGGNTGGSKSDTIGFEHRDDLKDSITISYRHLNSSTI